MTELKKNMETSKKDNSDELELRKNAYPAFLAIYNGVWHELNNIDVKSKAKQETIAQVHDYSLCYLFRLIAILMGKAREIQTFKKINFNNKVLINKIQAASVRVLAKEIIFETPVKAIKNHSISIKLQQSFKSLDTMELKYSAKSFSEDYMSLFEQRELDKIQINDYFLAIALKLLIFSESSIKFNYAELKVQIIGNLYESLLQFSELKTNQSYKYFYGSKAGKNRHIIIKLPKNWVCFDANSKKRKSTGTFYTPNLIVDYIVKNTVGKKLAEILSSKNKNKLNAILSLKILDPAMGCGNFLVKTVDEIAEFIVKNIGNVTFEAEINKITSKNLGVQKQDFVTAKYTKKANKLSSLTFWKQIVSTNCIYGVDLDNFAVQLAKISMQLHTLTDDSQNILDSHLKTGNALIGLWESENYSCECSLTNKISIEAQRKNHDAQLAVNYFMNFSTNAEKQQLLSQISKSNFENSKMFADALEIAQKIKFFHWKLEFPEVWQIKSKKKQGFNIVIGNPPYISFSGRQAVKISVNERRFYEDFYETSGWLSTHSLFIEQCLKHLTNRYLSFIVPDQIGHLKGYAKIREIIHKNSKLQSVKYWGEERFDSVISPCLTFVADKKEKSDTTKILHNDSAKSVEIRDKMNWLPIQELIDIPKMFENSFSLGKLVADPGVHTGNCSAKIIINFENVHDDSVLVLEGKQIFRYHCQKPRKKLILNYKKLDKEYFTIRNKKKYQEAEFLIRQTARFPIVSPKAHTIYFRNSVLALYPPKNQYHINYFVGILNSKLMKYIYVNLVHESSQKVFPQVKVKSLRELPIRKIDFEKPKEKSLHDKIANNVAKILNNANQKYSFEQRNSDVVEIQKLSHEFAKLDVVIDNLVYQLYELSSEEIRFIENSQF